MKRFFYLLLLLPLAGVAQNPTTLDGWAQRLQLFGSKIPQEEVFVHMDNTCYYMGDTIYYKAYMRLSDGRPSSLSHLLYVELLNHDGYLVERQKIEMKQGQGHGSFVLADTLYGGYYELRAYTRWQLNWGRYEHPHTSSAEEWFFDKQLAKDYYRDYEKLYSRVFPVYDKPREAGDYAQDMTLRPMQRQVKGSNETPKAVVTFYPEGGNLVAGVPNRVAFEVNREDGKHLKGKLKIKNEKLKVDAEAETVSRGRGTFLLDLTDLSADEVAKKVSFTWDGGTQEFALPKAVEDGVALQATVESDGIHIALAPHGTAAAEKLGLTASCHGVLKDFQTISSNDFVVPMDKLETGVVQLTIFNEEGRIYADRLVFVRQSDFQAQNISFEGVKPQYEPYEQVNLEVLSPANGSSSISMAVRDAASSDYTFDSGNILTEMLLASQIRGFVEHPEYFFEADDEEHRVALDLLLMVQGWRRYDWKTMAVPGAFALVEPYERTEVLMGQIFPYETEEQEDLLSRASYLQSFMEAADMDGTPMRDRPYSSDLYNLAERNVARIYSSKSGDSLGIGAMRAMAALWGYTHETNHAAVSDRKTSKEGGKLKNEMLLHAEFVQPGVKNGIVDGDMETFDNGKFKIETPRFYEACHFSLAASDTTKWKPGKRHTWVQVNEDSKGRLNYPEFYVKLNNPWPRFVKSYAFYQTAAPQARPVKKGPRFKTDDIVVMDEVTVRAKRTSLRKFDPSKPAFVLDAYDAFNQVIDAGLCPGYYTGARRFVDDIARTFVGDMGMERAYQIITRIDSQAVGPNILLFNESELGSSNLEEDPRFLRIQNALSNVPIISPQMKDYYDHLPNLDMVYVYTDYAPRFEGDPRYSQSNQPTVTVDLRRFENGGQRMTWRDRRMVLTGYAVCDDFYQPDYSKQKPAEPTDYRRTLYWNPNVQLNGEGRAKVSFFTGSKPAQLTLSAEGLTTDGQPLTGISYPEDR
ncbi:MAG: hypothetical protein J5671_07685 [Bacteroidaceae bacterium]|nr:hypothetical protein [Bacteroidaceae bacterium]